MKRLGTGEDKPSVLSLAQPGTCEERGGVQWKFDGRRQLERAHGPTSCPNGLPDFTLWGA